MTEVLQPEIVKEYVVPQKNLITVMVLSVALAHNVLGKNAPKGGKMEPGQGAKIIKVIEEAVKKTFPEVAPMILGMFGIELMTIKPLLDNPDKLIQEMIAHYSDILQKNANTNPQPNME